MSENETTRIAVLETDVKYIKQEVSEIKQMLIDHVKWEEKKYSDMGDKFASKEYEALLRIAQVSINEIPDKLENKFAHAWVEKTLIGTIVTMIGAALVTLFR